VLQFVRELEPGMIVRGKYHILEWIGAGGMAAVYRARHRMLNEDRAIKVVLPKYANEDDFLKRFRREAAVARKLRHENAVWVEDLDEIEDGRPFIAMEFLRGQDLRGLIHKEGQLGVDRTMVMAAQVASALSAAHDLGIVHRDIKPDNIFITAGKNGKEICKVLDFGIAKAMDGLLEGSVYKSTAFGMIVGTPQYMSPEQATGLGGNKLDGRSDIYSLGVVIYEMLTGRLPFESETPMGMMLQQINTRPQPPHQLMPALHIPEAVSAVLMKALEKKPEDRFQSADALVQALRNPAVWAASVAASAASVVSPVQPTRVVPATATPSITPPVAPFVDPTRDPYRTPQQPVRKSEMPPAAQDSPRWPAPERPRTEKPFVTSKTKAPKGGLQPWMAVALAAVVVLIVIAVINIPNWHTDDAQVQASVEQHLHSSFENGLTGVSIQVNDGVVTLAGSVRDEEKKELACSKAKEVSSVKGCVNNIAVEVARTKPTATPEPVHSPDAQETSDQHNHSIVPAIQDDVKNLQSNVAEGLLKQGKKEFSEENYENALNSFNAVLKVKPDDKQALAWKKKAEDKIEEERILGIHR